MTDQEMRQYLEWLYNHTDWHDPESVEKYHKASESYRKVVEEQESKES